MVKFINREILKKHGNHNFDYSSKKGFSINSTLRKKLYKNWNINENVTMIVNYL